MLAAKVHQVDLETLFRCSSGRKIVCETLIGDPPESFRLPPEDEAGWLDQNAVLDRKESTRGVISPNSSVSSSAASNSKRLTRKPSVIGLPQRQDPRRYCDPFYRRNGRRRSIRLPPRSGDVEPGSPKISCIGRIRSMRGRDGQRRKENSSSPPEKQVESKSSGFWGRFAAFFGRRKKISADGSEAKWVPAVESPEKKGTSVAAEERAAAGLGGLRRLASSRRSELWAEAEADVHVA